MAYIKTSDGSYMIEAEKAARLYLALNYNAKLIEEEEQLALSIKKIYLGKNSKKIVKNILSKYTNKSE